MQCSHCSKAFLNVAYLQSHLARRHQEMKPVQAESASPTVVPTTNREYNQLEKELQEIRERLRVTESQLNDERNSRNALTHKVMPLTFAASFQYCYLLVIPLSSAYFSFETNQPQISNISNKKFKTFFINDITTLFLLCLSYSICLILK